MSRAFLAFAASIVLGTAAMAVSAPAAAQYYDNGYGNVIRCEFVK